MASCGDSLGHRGAEFTFPIVMLCTKACALFTWMIDFKWSYVLSTVKTGLQLLYLWNP